jgi:hypothetical protein
MVDKHCVEKVIKISVASPDLVRLSLLLVGYEDGFLQLEQEFSASSERERVLEIESFPIAFRANVECAQCQFAVEGGVEIILSNIEEQFGR